MNRRSTNHNGCSLSWFVEGSGPPVVLIQGMGVAATGWRPQVEGLSAELELLSFDNRGMGQSQPLGAKLSVTLMAQDTLALMDAKGWTSAHLVGHSLGGLIALFVARLAPARVRSLSLISTFATGRVPTRLSPYLLAIGLRTRIGTRRMRRRAFLELIMPSETLVGADLDAMADSMAALFGHDLADQPPVVMTQFLATRRADAKPFLPGFAHIPTLVVTGEDDPIAPPSAGRALAAGIPNARYVELPTASHGVTIHSAQRINALLRDHILAAEK